WPAEPGNPNGAGQRGGTRAARDAQSAARRELARGDGEPRRGRAGEMGQGRAGREAQAGNHPLTAYACSAERPVPVPGRLRSPPRASRARTTAFGLPSVAPGSRRERTLSHAVRHRRQDARNEPRCQPESGDGPRAGWTTKPHRGAFASITVQCDDITPPSLWTRA